MFYRDEGAGPCVLLLHGYPTGSFDWHAVWPLLRSGRRLIAPDFLGLGFSEKPLRHDYSLAMHASRVDTLLQELHVTRVHVVAHDLGVRVAQEMVARRHTDPSLPAFDSIVLMNGALCADAYRPRPIQRLLATPIGDCLGPRVPRAAFDRVIRGLFGPRTQPSTALLDDYWALFEQGGGRRVAHVVGRFWRPECAQRERLQGGLLRSQLPLRLINGSADPNSGAHMVREWLRWAPDTDVVAFEAIGHWPQLEAPQETASAIESFWHRLPGHAGARL